MKKTYYLLALVPLLIIVGCQGDGMDSMSSGMMEGKMMKDKMMKDKMMEKPMEDTMEKSMDSGTMKDSM